MSKSLLRAVVVATALIAALPGAAFATSVDLSIYSITGSPDPITLGTGNVTYSVGIYNSSSSTGTNVVLTNALPASSTYVSSSATNSGSCSQSGGTVTCSWASIPAGSVYFATIVVTPTAGGALTLSSSVTGTESDPNTINNSASKAVIVDSQIDLGISSMTVSPDPITLGTGDVQFLVQFTNYSTSQATNAVLTSTIPVNSTFVSATTPVGSGSCSQSASTVTCNWASIPAGGTYYAYITVTPTAGGVLTLSSSVAATQSDSDTSNNSGSKSVTVNSQIDLGISSMTVSPDPMTLGTGDVQFLVQYTNNSTSQATSVVLTSTLPTNSTFVSATTPVGSGTCSHSGGTATCNWATIGPGSTYYAYITVTPTAGGSLSLTSTVSAAQSDPNTSNNTGTKASIVNAQIDLGISSMTVSPDPMTLGTGDVQFLVQYTNNSTSQATNAVLTSTIPVNSTFVSATSPVGSGTCSQSAGTVTCNWATIGPGSTYYAYITVTPTAGGVLTLSSTVSATQSDSDTSNNTGSKAVTVNSQIDLGISSMTVSPDPMTVGTGDVQFFVEYTNNSTSQATNVVLTSTLPTNSTFVSATTPVGSGTCSQSAGTVTCNWATIGAGSAFYAYITVTPTAAGSLSLTSTVSAAQSDPDTTNNTSTKASTVNSDIDLSISNITGSPDPITLGTGNVLYTVYMFNNSGSQATNVVLTSTLPAGTTFVSATTPVGSGTCNQSSGTVTCNWASLPAGSTYYAFITVTPTANGVITLAASIAGAQTDSNATNNSASKAVTVGSTGAGVDLILNGISATPDPITLNTGNVTYTVQVYNSSGTAGTGTVLTATLPTNSTYVSSSATGGGSCSQSGGTVTCNWSSIGAFTVFTATIVVTPTAGGSLSLTASVSGAETDPITANNSGNKTVTVNSKIDLQVYSLSGTPDPITLNTGNVTYTVQVYNPSLSQGTNTVLTNTLPANSTFVSASATGSGICTHSGTVNCTWTSIPASTIYTVTIVVTPTSGGALTLTSSVSGTEADPNIANNSASKSLTVNSQIDLRVYSMSGTPDPITLNNGNVTYTVSIYNPSTSQGTNTVLTNTLPANSTFVSASATNSGTCTHSGTVTCNWTSIPASGFYSATIVVTPTSGGSLTLSSSVAGTESDPNTADNSMSKSVTVNSQIDLQLYSISATPDPITLNTGNVTYTVSVYNPSTSPGTNTVLTNTLPANSTFVSATATNSGTCNQSGPTVTCNWTSIPSTGFYSATIVVTPTSGGALTLTSSVSGTESDSNTANNSASKSVTVNSQIDLRLYSLTATPDPITLNTGNVTYTVSIYNPSTSQGTSTVLTNTLPANSTFVSASATNSGTCTHSGGTVTCNWTSIPSAGFYTATIVVTPTSGGSMTLSSSVAGTESDPNTADNSMSKSVTVNSQIDLQLYSISGTPDPITLNTGNVTYTVLIYNASNSQGTGTTLTNTLPSNSTFVSATATNSGSCSQSAGTVTCNWTSIPATSLYSATIVVTPTAGGPLTIVSNVAGTESDSNPPNNNANKSVTVNSQIDLAVYSISGSPNPITFGAGNVTFTGYAYNQSTSQGTNVVLTNTLPSNSTYVSSSASNGGTCSHSGSTVTCSWTSIPATTLYPVTIVVTPTIPGTLTLSASVAGTQPDPNTADNTGSGTTTVTPTACTAVPSGAVAWYRAESNAVDSVGPNTGTANGSATYTTGNVGQAFSFNGTTAYVSVPDNGTLRPSSLTIEGWVKFNTIPSTATIVSKTVGSGTNDSYVIWYQGGALHAAIGNTAGNGPSVDYTWAPATNTWYHVAYTYDSAGQAQVLYVNGATVGSGTNSTAIGFDTNPLIIGAEIESSTPTFFFPGLVDELTLYSRALTQTEVQAIYGAGTFGKCYTAPSAPSVTGFTPASGSIGTSVVITGTGFSGVSSVTFNGTSATFTVNSTSQITATVPAAATTGLITVTAGGGSASSASNFTVCTAPAATITPSGPTTFCTGGSVTLTASAGASYQWSNSATPIAGATAQQLTVTAAGNYTVTVTNVLGCSATSSPASVTVDSVVNVTISGATAFCTGGNTTLTANPSGGSGIFSSYQWLLGGSPIGGATASTYNATAGGSYNVTATDSIGCTGTSTPTTVTVNASPPAAINAPASACANSTVAASIVGGAVAGATYTWSVGNGVLQTGQGTSSITFTVGTATPVSLSVIASLNGCPANGSASITVAPFTPTITPSGPTSFCAGGSVTLTSSAGASYQWILSGSPIAGANAQSYVATTTGNYSVSVTTGTGCSGTSATTTVTVNSAVSVTISGPTAFCTGGNVTLTANPSGGSGSFSTYHWLLNGTPIGGATASSYNATAGGSYSVTVTDSGGCTGTSAPTTVTANTPPPAAINAPASACANSTVVASIVGGGVAGATYTWTVGNGTLQTGQGTSSITFTVGTASPVSLSVVATLNGCPANGSASITIGAFTPTITTSGPASFCAGGSVTLTSSSGASYQWRLGGVPIGGANAQSYAATAIGNYSVTVTTGAGCSGTSAATTVTQTTAPSPVITPSGPTTFCSGGSVTLTSSAATSYQWLLNGSPINGATSSSFGATVSGSYSVAVTNGGGCSGTSPAVTVTVSSTSTAIIAPSSVSGGSVGNIASVAAGPGGSTYAWTITGGTITSGNGTSSIAWTAGSGGSVIINVTVTSGLCVASASANIAILDSADLVLTMTGAPNPVSAGGTVTLTLNVANNGPNTAQNVRLANNLFGVTAPSASGSGWSCSTTGLTIVCSLASLPVGPAAPVTITATAADNGSAGDNASTAAANSDPNGNNNNAGITIPINALPSCNNAAPSAITPAAGAANLANPVNFTWSAAANATSYDLWIASSGSAPVIATTTTSTSAAINLPSGTSTWYVAAHFTNDCPTLFSSPRDLTVAASANCTHPAAQLIAPSPNAVVNSPVTFSWTPVAQAVGYRLWVALDGGAPQDVGTTNGATSLTVPLTGTSVAWHVDAIFPGCDPTSSASSTFTIASIDPCAGHSAPSLLTPSPNATLASSVVDFHWSAVAGANGYRLWASINGGAFAPLGTTASATTLHTTFTSGTVAWYVEALFNGCASAASAQQSFTISAAATCNNPAATSLTPSNGAALTSGTVDFAWSPAQNAIGYELWLSFNNGTPSLAGTTTATTLKRSIGAGSIEWFVRAQFNGCDPVESAHAHFTYAPPADCAIVRPMLTAPVDGASAVLTPFDLQWSNVPGATQYMVWLASGDAPPAVIGTTSSTHLDNQSAPQGSVTWFVDALFDNCPSLRSTSSTFTAAQPLPPCSTPGVPSPRAESTASTNVEYVIRWTPTGPADTTQYEIQESLTSSFASPVSITTDGSEWPFKHVNSGDAPVSYYYRVRSVGTCTGERSLFSLTLTVQVLPSSVTNPASANGSTPADNPQTTNYEIHIGGGTAGSAAHKGTIAAAAGETFTATTNQPWLTVSPSSGTVPPEGMTLTVTATTNGLPVGTSSGGVTISFGSSTGSQHGNVTGLGTTPPATTTVSVNLVQPVSPTAKSAPPPDALIIPAVAHADGINSKFQSDVRVTNSSAQPMKYQVTFTPTGDGGITQGNQTTVDIDPGQTLALDDVLESWFGSNGATGTLEVRPLTTAPSSTTAVPAGLANILTFAASRTYNTTANGTFGQYIPAIPFAAFVGRGSDPSKSTILSLQQIAQSPAYRTNLGIVEGSGDPASVLISVFGDNGQKLTEFTQDLKGGQQLQLNSILAQKNLQVSDGRIEVKVVSPVGKVTAYASVLDNQTNDPLLVPPVAVNQAAASMYVLPGVADLNNGVANWQSDVRVFNPSTSIVKATLTYYSQSGGTPQSKDISLAPGQVQTFDSALQSLFGISNDGGALHIATTATTPLVATARTYNQTPNGTYGQFVPAVTANDAAALGSRPLQILQIEESDRYRTNVGFAEVTGNAATIEVTAVPSDSKVAASTQIDLAPNQYVQYPQLLKSMGLTNMYNARVTVKVISGQGRVTAYASVIDMQTNDPTFVPAQ
ncbi:MAG TPA: LamG-like jellyroll fold domain-containing protein [Thermoanaerobaculia bacterium]|nr:LamG-like jellyroll fold domain-containing protein [Thermoanaerobaculia bacterium]